MNLILSALMIMNQWVMGHLSFTLIVVQGAIIALGVLWRKHNVFLASMLLVCSFGNFWYRTLVLDTIPFFDVDPVSFYNLMLAYNISSYCQIVFLGLSLPSFFETGFQKKWPLSSLLIFLGVLVLYLFHVVSVSRRAGQLMYLGSILLDL